MSDKPSENIPASIHQRLLNIARKDARPFNELLQYFAMERFLYRLSQSQHADRFILKGALLLRAWQASEFRPTMDIDLLGITSNREEGVIAQIHDILSVSVEPDGLDFDPGSLRVDRITENAEYEGIRARFKGVMGSAKINMQIDIGFGDVIFPEPEKTDLPAMLDFPAPRLLCYTRESAIAEKFEAMIKLGELNSRMKDFYNIWLLSRQYDFEGTRLGLAIERTFERRGTALPEETVIFSEAFINVKQIQWTAFRKRLPEANVPADFRDVVSTIKTFLEPLAGAMNSRTSTSARWTAPGPWS